MSGKECLGHLQLFGKKKKEGFGLAVLFHRKVGHREGGGIPALSSSGQQPGDNLKLLCPCKCNEPGLGHVQCLLTAEFFLHKELCLKGHKAFKK